jgi:hypothetical protein
VRVEGPHIVVSCRSPRGVAHVHRYGRRDGVTAGGGHRAELVNPETTDASPQSNGGWPCASTPCIHSLG